MIYYSLYMMPIKILFHVVYLFHKNTSRGLALLLVFTLSFGGFLSTKQATAATITPLSDTMSTQARNVTATHTIVWTQSVGVTAGDTITIDFTNADFTLNSAGSWQTSDFAYTDNVRSAQAPVAVGAAPSCSAGATNYTVTVDATNNTFTITACSSWTTSNTAAKTFVIYGTAATGAGTMTNVNADTDSSVFTITNTGSNTDSGSGALVIETNDVVTVTATVNPTLTFAISSSSVSLGTLTTGAIGSGSHTLAAATNATGGYAITYNGATLTSGSDTIDANAGSTAVAGTEEFGINLRDNATPNVGSDVTASAGSCGYASGYGTADSYVFVPSTTTTITSITAAADCTYTVSYVASISSITPAGSYSTAITYVATGTF